jgi:hypothetical protein
MLLPELTIPVSIEVFTMNLEYFIRDYANLESETKLSFEKQNDGSKAYRYFLYCQRMDSKNSTSIKIGEIDVIMMSDDKVRVNAAVSNIEKIREALDVFDKFYLMIYENWEIAPYVRLDGFVFDDNVATMTLFHTAQNEEVYKLHQGKYHDLDFFNFISKMNIDYAISMIRVNVSSFSEPKYKEILQKYHSEIFKSLPENHRIDRSSDSKKINVRPKIKKRFQELREIKEKNPYLSQTGTVLKYNQNRPEDEQIKVYDLQYAYKAMGEKWENSKNTK